MPLGTFHGLQTTQNSIATAIVPVRVLCGAPFPWCPKHVLILHNG